MYFLEVLKSHPNSLNEKIYKIYSLRGTQIQPKLTYVHTVKSSLAVLPTPCCSSTLKWAESSRIFTGVFFPAHCMGTEMQGWHKAGRKQDQAARRAKGYAYLQQCMYWIIILHKKISTFPLAYIKSFVSSLKDHLLPAVHSCILQYCDSWFMQSSFLQFYTK